MNDHDYLSTACYHAQQQPSTIRADALHDYCKSKGGSIGPKKASVCKFCGVKCRCECHQEDRR